MMYVMYVRLYVYNYNCYNDIINIIFMHKYFLVGLLYV